MAPSLRPFTADRQHRQRSPQYSPRSDGTSHTDPLTPESPSGSEHEVGLRSDHEDHDRMFELKPIVPVKESTIRDRVTSHDDGDSRDSLDGGDVAQNGDRRKDSFMLYTPDEERNVVRKLDRRVVIFLAFLYMLSFLDRSSMLRASESVQTHELSDFRYRKRKNRGPIGGPAPQLVTVRVALDRILHHIHSVRMDDAIIPSGSSAHLYLPMCCVVGACCIAAICGKFVHKHVHPSHSSWCGRGGFWTWGAILSIFLLQKGRVGTTERFIHLCSTLGNLIRKQSCLAHHQSWGKDSHRSLALVIPDRRISEHDCCCVCVVQYP